MSALTLPVPPLVASDVMTHQSTETAHVSSHMLAPLEAPIVGRTTPLKYAVTDNAGDFRVANCACQLSIVRNGQVVFRYTDFTGAGDNTLEHAYRFPAAGEYRVVLSGYPIEGSRFHPFNLSHTIVVKTTISPIRVLVGGLFGASIGYFLIRRLC